MSTIALVACVSRKGDGPAAAGDLYVSPWFRKARAYAQSHADRWYILSAEHGLLDPATPIAPYHRTLHAMTGAERRAWAQRVGADLQSRVAAGDRALILAGTLYRAALVLALERRGVAVDSPMRGLGIGEQLRWLTLHAVRQGPAPPTADTLQSTLVCSQPRAALNRKQ